MQFSDPIDQGSHLAALHTEEAIKAHARKAAPQQTRNADGTWPITVCVTCGEDIEEKRLEAGRIRCVSCQTWLEKEEKQSGHR